MSCLKEQTHRSLDNDGSETSAVYSSENYGCHLRTLDVNIDSGDHTDFSVSGVMPHGSGGEWSGYSREAGSSRMEHHCTNYRFYPPPHDAEPSLPQYPFATHGDDVLPQSSPFHLMNPSLANNSHLSSLGGQWSSEGPVHCNMMSGEIYDAVASICPDSKDDHGQESYRKQETMVELMPQNQMDISQSANGPLTVYLQHLDHQPGENATVVCNMSGRGQMVVMNHCSPGQILHSLPPGHPDCSPETHYYTTSSKGNSEQTYSMGKASQSYLPSMSLPPIGPNHSLLSSNLLVSPGPSGSGYSYNHMPGPYFSQYHQYPEYPDSLGLVPDGQSMASSVLRLSGSLWDSKSKKPCNCTKSQCLKLYCDCFANGDVCSNCNCINCCNNNEHESERYKAIKICLDRNPEAFRPKIGNGKLGEIKGRHNKGCNCKRSGCLKNYCECYEAKIMCSSTCKCVGCRNYEDSPERKTMMWDSPDTTFYKKAKCDKDKCPLSCITLDVVEATCGCLLAQAEEAEKEGYMLCQAEKMILEEFGQCLTQIPSSESPEYLQQLSHTGGAIESETLLLSLTIKGDKNIGPITDGLAWLKQLLVVDMRSRATIQWTCTIIVILLIVESQAQKIKLNPNRWGPQSMMYLKGKYGTRDVPDYDDSVYKSGLNGWYTLIKGQRLRSLNFRKPRRLRTSVPLLGVLKIDGYFEVEVV